jgi:hypothetical protein
LSPASPLNTILFGGEPEKKHPLPLNIAVPLWPLAPESCPIWYVIGLLDEPPMGDHAETL